MRIWVIPIVSLLAACSLVSEPHAPTGNLPTGTVSVETASEDLTFSVEIAETDATREWGLMGRSSLPQGSGMAFVYESPTDGPFWMKDTPIPLTIAFWRSDGTIVDVLDMEPCETESCPRYRPSGAYVGALEVNQGALAGVGPGDTVELKR